MSLFDTVSLISKYNTRLFLCYSLFAKATESIHFYSKTCHFRGFHLPAVLPSKLQLRVGDTEKEMGLIFYILLCGSILRCFSLF